MKKQSPNSTPAPADPLATETQRTALPAALDPSEITLVPLDQEHPFANPEPGEGTQALPIQGPGKTADIAPALLLDASRGPVLLAPPGASRPASARKLWAGAALCLLVLAGGAAYWFLRPEPEDGIVNDVLLPLPPTPAPETVPPELRSYLDQAKGGDARAMHMIALMYWNGLNVRQDRVKGLDWYRKAAAAGDKAAQKELAVIEGK